MSMTKRTPVSVGELLDEIRTTYEALYKDLAKQTWPMDDEAFDRRLHEFILMLKRYEKENC